MKGNLLDLVLTNVDDIIYDLAVNTCHPLISSDHFIISFSVRDTTPSLQSNKGQFVFDISKADLNGLLHFLLDSDFSVCFQSDSVEHVWAVIKNIIYNGMHQHIPKVKLKSHACPKWFDSEIRHQLNRLRTLRRRCRSHPTPHILDKLQLYETNVQNRLIAAKTSFEANLIQQKNNSKIFKYIRTVSGQGSIPSSIGFESISASTDFEKATLFNIYFHSIFTKSSFALPQMDTLPLPQSCRSDISISEYDVYDALVSLDPQKSMGIDGIGPKLLKHCALALHRPLHHLFLLTFSQNQLPEEWRTHLITPIHKCGDKSNVKNYRPISLLCSISKVLEKVIFEKIIDFIMDHVTPNQFGFLRHRSTLHQLLVFLHHIFKSFNSNAQTDVIYLDFKKAFDSVAHNELLVKLRHFGVTGSLWNWFKTYLSSRKQCVRFNNVVSNHLPVISGVPQGSLLGPILFLIFVNDISDSVLSSKVLLFADDTKCYKTIYGSLDSHSLQLDINQLSLWSHHWNLLFNEQKCVLMRFSLKSPALVNHTYYINGEPALQRDNHRDLGIIMSSNLSWTAHYQHILFQAYKMLSLLRRVFSTAHCPQTKKTLYLALVKSKLMYNSQIWRPQFIKDITLIEQLQRRATKYILGDYTSSYKTRLIHLNLLPLMMQFELNDVLFFVSCFKCPSEAFDILEHVSFSNHSTRSSVGLKLKHTKSRTNSVGHFYFNRLPRLWNSLPVIDLNMSLSSIKKSLKQFFWQQFILKFNADDPCTFHFVCPCAKCSLSSIKKSLKQFFWQQFILKFNADNPCTFHFVS